MNRVCIPLSGVPYNMWIILIQCFLYSNKPVHTLYYLYLHIDNYAKVWFFSFNFLLPYQNYFFQGRREEITVLITPQFHAVVKLAAKCIIIKNNFLNCKLIIGEYGDINDRQK